MADEPKFMRVERSEYESMVEKGQKAYSKLRSVGERVKEQMAHVRQTLEVNAAAFGVSWAVGRWGDEKGWSLWGVPVELGAGVVLQGLGYAGVLGAYKEDAHNLGDGAFAAFVGRKGLELGRKAASDAPAKKSAPRAAAGALGQGAYSGGPLSDAALNEILRAQGLARPQIRSGLAPCSMVERVAGSGGGTDHNGTEEKISCRTKLETSSAR